MHYSLYIENQKVDLFPDENFEINSKLKDLRDIEKVFSDYSQDFTCPASKANNTIFKHYYDATVDDGFDGRVQADARIEINGFTFKIGSVKLLNCVVKKNKIYSYRIQFFTQIAKIQEVIGDDSFTDIEWLDNFNHIYNYANVKEGLTTGLDFPVTNGNKSIMYPLISYEDRWVYNETASANYVDVKTDGVFYYKLKPAISFPALLQAVREKYDLNFQGDIFRRREFEFAYMNLNGRKDEGVGLTETLIGTQVIVRDFPEIAQGISLDMNITVSNQNAIYKLRVKKIDSSGTSEQVFENIEGNTGVSAVFDQAALTPPSVNVQFRYYITTSSPITVTIDNVLIFYNVFSGGQNTQQETFQVSGNADVDVIVKSQFSESLKVLDWLKSIFKIFNVVVETDLQCTPIQEWFGNGKLKDFTKYANQEKLEIKPSALYSEINLGWEANETFLASNFAANNEVPFGSLEEVLLNPDGKKLEGEPLEVELPYEKPIFEKIKGLSYGYFVDKDQNVLKSQHSIFYVITRGIGYLGGMKLKDATTNETINSVRCPSTSIFGFALNWDNEFDEYSGQIMPQNIYNTYYRAYTDFIFNTRRRNYTLDVHLPYSEIQDLQQNDRLVIDNTRYLINSFKANLKSGVVKFDLFNDLLTDVEFPPFQFPYTFPSTGGTGKIRHDFSPEFDFIDSDDNAAFSLLEGNPEQDEILFELNPNTSTTGVRIINIIEAKTDGTRLIVANILQNKML